MGIIPWQRWTFLGFDILKALHWNTGSQKFKVFNSSAINTGHSENPANFMML